MNLRDRLINDCDKMRGHTLEWGYGKRMIIHALGQEILLKDVDFSGLSDDDLYFAFRKLCEATSQPIG